MRIVHVIGCGPAGAIAAINACTKHEVIMSEEHLMAGLPTNCSGIFSKEGLESFSDLFDYRQFIKNEIHGARIDFAGQEVFVKKNTAVGFICDRAKIDQRLAQVAEERGVRIEYGKKISTNYYSDNIIGADGPLSTVAQNFNFPKIKKFALTMQKEIRYKQENTDDKKIVEMFFSNEKFPGFFAWIIPRDEETAEFGAGTVLPNNARKAWDNLLKLKNIPEQQGMKAALIPLETRKITGRKIGKRNVILVGDAAGQTKSTTGGGVIFGGRCAGIAGKNADNPLKYELEWRAKYGMDFFLHKKIHDYLEKKSDKQIGELGKKLKKMDFDSFLSKDGHMDLPTRMIRPNLLLHLIKGII
ncbi:MAG: NAD(P)/FAD-dependent oxidoreductase [Candidatus Micrarchaeota archaeon]